MTPADRRKADRKLSLAMESASRCIGTIIKLGEEIVEDVKSLDAILMELKDILPSGTRQRIFTSYGLLIHCTFKVIHDIV